MQIENWNNLRCLLAIKRGRTIAAGARMLAVDNTTLSRRLAALQSASGDALFFRQADGTLTLTPIGEAMVRHVESMEHETDQISNLIDTTHGSCIGSVRLTSVPIIINRLFTPSTGVLLAKHPLLELEMIPDSRDLSLTQREADIAVRLARPTTGGSNVKARRMAKLEYSVYAAKTFSVKEVSKLPWITYDESLAHLPQSKWVAGAIKTTQESVYGLRVHDADTAMEAVVSGFGKTLLPSIIASRDKRLQHIDTVGYSRLPIREVWLLSHADKRKFSTIDTVISWIEDTMKQAINKA